MIPRLASEADLPALAVLHQKAFAPGWNAEELADVGSGPGVFGLLVEGEAGLAGMILCRAAAGEAEVITLAVDPHLRRTGVAKALLAAGLEVARSDGALEVFLEVADDNIAALALYERMGFLRVGLRRGYYDRGEIRIDAVVMRLDLTNI